jgi:adenosylhomocysteine nucleosidase
MREIPFYCIKGVSDGLRDRLPDFNPFLTPEGRFRLLPFVFLSVIRPWYWPALLRMGENSKRASQSIVESLRDFLDAQSLDE